VWPGWSLDSYCATFIRKATGVAGGYRFKGLQGIPAFLSVQSEVPATRGREHGDREVGRCSEASESRPGYCSSSRSKGKLGQRNRGDGTLGRKSSAAWLEDGSSDEGAATSGVVQKTERLRRGRTRGATTPLSHARGSSARTWEVEATDGSDGELSGNTAKQTKRRTPASSLDGFLYQNATVLHSYQRPRVWPGATGLQGHGVCEREIGHSGEHVSERPDEGPRARRSSRGVRQCVWRWLTGALSKCCPLQ
jgi:hypothetical protein